MQYGMHAHIWLFTGNCKSLCIHPSYRLVIATNTAIDVVNVNTSCAPIDYLWLAKQSRSGAHKAARATRSRPRARICAELRPNCKRERRAALDVWLTDRDDALSIALRHWCRGVDVTTDSKQPIDRVEMVLTTTDETIRLTI